MTQHHSRVLASVLAVASLSLMLSGAAKAAEENAKSAAAFPKGQYAALNALPDWGGVWTLNFSRPSAGSAPEKPALKGQYLKDYQAWQREVTAKEGLVTRKSSNCLPPGLPGIMSVPQYPVEFLFTPGKVTMHHEAWMQWRTVYTDGRGHPSDWEATFYGHSIGHWEGATLVVDSVGIKPTVDLSMGMKHSEQLHIVERIHLAQDDPNMLVIETTLDDRLALEKPWHTRATYTRSREGELIEFICAENDRNPVDEAGNTQFK